MTSRTPKILLVLLVVIIIGLLGLEIVFIGQAITDIQYNATHYYEVTLGRPVAALGLLIIFVLGLIQELRGSKRTDSPDVAPTGVVDNVQKEKSE